MMFTDMLIWYVAFLFSVTAHEASHALAAMKGGDLTAHRGGQVSLNPVPHIRRSPFGTVVVPIGAFFLSGFMIGWASAPFDPEWAARHPRRAAWMAAAGPAANLAILLAAFVLIKLFMAAGIFQTPSREELNFTTIVTANGAWIGMAKLLSVLLILNLILFIFNLFPFPPLDGSSVITLFMPQEWALKYTRFINQPMYALLGLVLAWRLFGSVFIEVFRFVFSLIHAPIS